MFATFRGHADLFDPLLAEAVRLVNAAAKRPKPEIDSSRAGMDALTSLSSWWRGEFPRRFPGFPVGSERGIFGMTLWNYLAGVPEQWCFCGVEDPHGYGQSHTRYWRI
jgi:hypothetical protein